MGPDCLIILFLVFLIYAASTHPILYVSSIGTDDNSSSVCSNQSPCASLSNALWIREHNTLYSAQNEIEIIVYGENTDWHEQHNISWHHYLDIEKPVIITFKTSQLIAWNAIYAIFYDYSDERLIINNLYHNEKHVQTSSLWYINVYGGGLILNNCTFVGSNISESLIEAYHLEIYDSVFSDISYNGNIKSIYFEQIDGVEFERSFLNIYPYDDDLLILSNTIFKDIRLLSAQLISAFTNGNGKVMHMQHCTFTNVSLDDEQSLLYFSSNYFSDIFNERYTNTSAIYITNVVFMNIHGGSLITLDFGVNSILENIYILISDYRITDDALITVHSSARAVVNNLYLKYQVNDQLNDICVNEMHDEYNMSWYDDIWISCTYSKRLLNNDGYITMSDTYITNDLTYTGLQQYRDDAVSNDPILHDKLFYFMYVPTGNNIPSLIYNNGIMQIDNMTVSGVAVCFIPFINKGIAILNDINILKPDFIWNYDIFGDMIDITLLYTHEYGYMVINEGSYGMSDIHLSCNDVVLDHCVLDGIDIGISGIVVIENSYIVGDGVVLDNNGRVGIYNTYVLNATYVVQSSKSTSLNIIGCTFKDIGEYYSGALSRHSHPFLISGVEHAIIKNNTFDFFAEYGYLWIQNLNQYMISYIIIKNNHFLDPITPENFDFDYNYPYKQQIMSVFNWTQDEIQLKEAIQWLYDSNNGSYRYESLVQLEGYIESNIIGNIFERNDILMTMLYKSCLHIRGYDLNKYSNTHCVSGNVFYGSALTAINATITSCIHPDLSINEETLCWTETGAMNIEMIDTNYANTMIATDKDIPLIEIIHSHIILDETAIITDFTIPPSFDANGYYPFSLSSEYILSIHNMNIKQANFPITIEFPDHCLNLCTELYQDSMQLIHQFHINCMDTKHIELQYYNVSSEALIPLSESEAVSSVNNTLPSILFLNSSGLLYPGGALDIEYTILDSHNKVIDDWNGELYVSLTSSEFGFDTTMYINTALLSSCDICDNGLYIQNVRMDSGPISTKQYVINAVVEHNLLMVNDLYFTITECPSGFGLNEIFSQCYECNVGEFSIKPSHLPCISCTTDENVNIKGFECSGKDKIIISQNYWIGLHYAQHYDIVSQRCPSRYCSYQIGEYLQLKASNQLCALNRDPNVPLCGTCLPGFSELFGTNNCGECEHSRMEIWFLFVFFSVVFAVIIVFANAIPKSDKEDVVRKCGISWETRQYTIIAIQKPILYHYQSLSFIFLNTDVVVLVMAFADIFNFQLEFGANTTETLYEYCWIKGLNAKYEIILNLTIPAFTVFTIGVMAVIHRLKAYKLLGKTVNFGKAFVNMLLLVIGTICGICFKLIGCRTIGDDYVHFYFGNEECFSTIWFVAAFSLFFVVILFCFCMMKLCNDHRKRVHLLKRKDYVLKSLIKSFNIEQYWYWEMVMFSRRFMIAMLNAWGDIKNTGNTLFLVLIIFSMAHLHTQPFRIHEINVLETVCLFCLLSVLYILANGVEEDDIFSVLILNGLIILPLLVFIISWIWMNLPKYGDSVPNFEEDDDMPAISVQLSAQKSLEECRYIPRTQVSYVT